MEEESLWRYDNHKKIWVELLKLENIYICLYMCVYVYTCVHTEHFIGWN